MRLLSASQARPLLFGSLLALGTVFVASCGMKMQQTHGTRASGQSRLMDDTVAGQGACDTDDHTRPFIIEWDATDMSSFESLAASDIVIVKYEGCKLRVLDECRNDSIRGSQGAYKPPEWTSGSLETIDIHNEGELYAKLPLGAATLGGRVSGGEKFHMEYFVAGTTYATRDAVYRADLESNPGCDAATHFVYGYNLGAFALGSMNEASVEAGGSAYGFGAGGKQSSGRSAEKKGGDLGVCRAHDATEVVGCKAPIRLNLREIRDGESPQSAALAATDTAASASAAALVNDKIEMSEEARARIEAANVKLQSGDGNACIKELDAHDKLDAKHKSTDPQYAYSSVRATCLMKTGKCKAGKDLFRKYLEKNSPHDPNTIASTVDQAVGMHCQGGDMSSRDKLIVAIKNLMDGGYTVTKDAAFCSKHYKVAKAMLPKVKPRNQDDHQINNAARNVMQAAPSCYQRAGDCKAAFTAYKETMDDDTKARINEQKDPKVREQYTRAYFEGAYPKCKGK